MHEELFNELILQIFVYELISRFFVSLNLYTQLTVSPRPIPWQMLVPILRLLKISFTCISHDENIR